ncbi:MULTISPECIES: S8 family peptidase [Acinetobacter]|uniref:S8 family peptidase n=1 Tax=Acinetobacter TaxID=469 RepID=UPI0001B8E65F|nr:MULTISPECIES: S8 family peptidase [Acinetobacter]EEX01568.1 hypothetical protein HMPREF0014_00165 [Acinetobacter sp. RUH 2624]MBR7739535.1 S8 family peptidase [Acinetobacter nosocomialis]MBZ6534616.1 S8 family peptidase [Acinetobacter seifertii]QNY07059.1 S8 family peptidase [Acinetobacter seifertii]
MKNFLIGYGETITNPVYIKTGGGDKKHPYSIEEGRLRFQHNLEEIMWEIENKPTDACANDEVVVKFIQHPSYLAKTYYPRKLFKKFGMKDIGSKSVKISPDSWATRKHPDIAVTSCIYVSGKKTDYQKMLKNVEENDLDQATLDFIRTIERVDIFTSEEKIKNLDPTRQINKLEVVIHASQEEESILEAFLKYVEKLGGNAEKNKSKFVGGLTFLPVTIEHGLEEELAEFSHLRALRSIPKLRFNKPNLTRTQLKEAFAFPQNYQLSDKFKVCIFDGGLGSTHLLGDLAKEIIPVDVSTSHPHFLAHGSEVCSTYLFGPYQPGSGLLGSPYTSVDVVRVLSPEDEHDPDLFNVLSRIEAVLKEKKYKYINLSLGPQIAVDDDDVHVWTSVLDQYLQDGHCLATIAIGNDGDLPGELGRIQPPSDMVNSLAIGAIDCQSKDWERAPYSCTGPGRSPGLIKPDGVLFGGSEKEMFHVYSPLTHSIIATMGTSFASPLAMRVAAGIDALTDFELTTNSIKALMIHKAKPEQHSQNNVGWGKLPHQPEEVLECLDDEATILFQGELKPDQHLRIPIPVPKDADCTWVILKATFSINAITDPEHPLHYTRSGLDITFRANQNKKNDEQQHPDAKTFFSSKGLYLTEEELREDAHKWETTISRSQRFKLSTLEDPLFDVKYHAREQGAATEISELSPIRYSLVLSIQTVGDVNVYNSILQKNQTLLPVKVSNRIQL